LAHLAAIPLSFSVTIWIFVAIFANSHRSAWLFGLSGSATLVYLSRPDGAVIIIATLLLLPGAWAAIWQEKRSVRRLLLAASPLMVVPIHLLWRILTYGEWLPNTYYAKHVSAWPEAGARYFASFVLEYALWVWMLALVAVVIVKLMRLISGHSVDGGATSQTLAARILSCYLPPSRRLCTVVVVTALLAHLSYYTLVIGGDHFEYRVYSFWIPLIFLSFMWMLSTLRLKVIAATGLMTLFVLMSFPVPWTHWALTHNLTTRDETLIMQVPVSPSFPGFLQWYSKAFDSLQYWLIEHGDCVRHQEHKIFYEHQKRLHVPRSVGERVDVGRFSIMAVSTVGFPGWVFPQVAMIDAFGLNDYVVARHQQTREDGRVMAHDRYPPEGYVESFDPNLQMLERGQIGYREREVEMTAERIVAIEEYWINKVVHGMDTVDVMISPESDTL